MELWKSKSRKRGFFGLVLLGYSIVSMVVLPSTSLHHYGNWSSFVSHMSMVPTETTMQQEPRDQRFGCRHVDDVRTIRFQEHTAGDTLHILLTQPDGHNIFHTLWSYVPVFRDAMNYGVLPYAKSLVQKHIDKVVTIHVALPSRHAWFEMMVKGFPTGSDKIVIHTTLMAEYDGENDDHTAHDEAVLTTLRQTHGMTADNCVTFKQKWSTFVGTHGIWHPNTPGYTAKQMYHWANNMRSIYVGSHIHKNEHEQENQIENTSDAASHHQQREVQEEHDNGDACRRERPLALFVERTCTGAPRTPMDLDTGEPAFPLIMPLAEQLGYDTELLTLCNETLPQFTTFSRANVVVSVHGAQMTNIIFMKPCHQEQQEDNDRGGGSSTTIGFHPALLEISFRFAWCDPKELSTTDGSRAAMLDRWKRCPQEGRVYHKADFFRLATAMDVRYVEIIQDSLVDLIEGNSNPISVKGVTVNSSLILQELHRLKHDNQYDYKRQSDYNGMEGVTTYEYGANLMEIIRERVLVWARSAFTAYL